MAISERARAVLNQVVTLHYRTCEPVGSGLISRTKTIPFSPATIRNIMLNLDEMGYLRQPHTSAGRLPTDLGYRTYVNNIRLARPDLKPIDQQSLLESLDRADSGAGALETIADFIHRRTSLMTFHAPFRQSGMRLRRVHFERLNPDRILALWVSRGGQSYQTLLEIPAAQLSPALAEKVANYLNKAFFSKSLIEIQRALASRGGASGSEWDILLDKAALIEPATVSTSGSAA